MIESQLLTKSQMAEEADCSKPTIKHIRRNLRQLGSVRAPSSRVGWRCTVPPLMLEALYEHLLEKPGFHLDEMVIFLWDICSEGVLRQETQSF